MTQSSIAAGFSQAPAFRTFLFSVTLFLSAALMFIVQLVLGKMMLPMVGGSPNGWLVAMAYFQLALLVGYGLAHFLSRFSPFVHMAIVLVVLVGGLLSLPLHLGGGLAEKLSPMAGDVFFSLLVSITLPFLGLSLMSPSLQRLFASGASQSSRDPYFLFAASNLGSFIGLLSYPLIIERVIGLSVQSSAWQGGYIALIVLCAACLTTAGKNGKPSPARIEDIFTMDWRSALKWVGLAFIPSSLTLGVTAQITMDGGSIPFFWVLPLALYLLTFVIAFSRVQFVNRKFLTFLYPMGLVPLLFIFIQQPLMIAWNLMDVIPQIVAFLIVTMFCHFRLADMRPEANQLTGYYLCVALGGALGGFFNVFIAPWIFPLPFEFIIVAFASCLIAAVRPWTNAYASRLAILIAAIAALVSTAFMSFYGGAEKELVRIVIWPQLLFIALLGATFCFVPNNVKAVQRKQVVQVVIGCLLIASLLIELTIKISTRAQFINVMPAVILLLSLMVTALQPKALLAVAVICAALAFANSSAPSLLEVQRSFFGILHVRDITYGDGTVARYFNNGSTIHGIQKVQPRIDLRPTSYYTPEGPLGDIMAIRNPRDVGMIGMGAGTTVCFKAPKRHFTVYDINPDVPVLANKWFYFFKYCGVPDIKIGDGRKLLQNAHGAHHDVLVVDAFSSDAIPVHLMTGEALKTYFDRLSPNGVLALHLTNRYYELVPTAIKTANSLGLQALYKYQEVLPEAAPDSTSLWVVVARPEVSLKSYIDRGWMSITSDSGDVWTDDFSHPISILSTQSILNELGYAKKN